MAPSPPPVPGRDPLPLLSAAPPPRRAAWSSSRGKKNNEILEPHPPAGTCDTAQARGWHTPSPTLAPGAAPGPAAGTGALRVAQMGCGGGRVTAPSPSPRAGMSWQSIPHPCGTHTAPAPAGVGCPAGYPGGCPALHPPHTPLAAPCACPVFCPPPPLPGSRTPTRPRAGRKSPGGFFISLSPLRSQPPTHPQNPRGFGSAALPGPPPQGLSEAPGTAEVPGGGRLRGCGRGWSRVLPAHSGSGREGGTGWEQGWGGISNRVPQFPLPPPPPQEKPLPTPGAPRGG